uniref:hypothetical protein n=1 Tax=Aeromonas jandaei TaxID=650 RepID=UPI001E2E95E5
YEQPKRTKRRCQGKNQLPRIEEGIMKDEATAPQELEDGEIVPELANQEEQPIRSPSSRHC